VADAGGVATAPVATSITDATRPKTNCLAPVYWPDDERRKAGCGHCLTSYGSTRHPKTLPTGSRRGRSLSPVLSGFAQLEERARCSITPVS
jgi:hypothetical protein